MNKFLLTTITTMLAAPVLAKDVNETLDADADGRVHVSNIAGSVTVNGWDRSEVRVTGSLGRNVKELYFDRDDDEITIKVKVPKKSGRGIDSDLTINVPHGSSVDVGTVSADIEVEGVNGDQKLQSVSGDIDAEFSGEDLYAESVSGDVEIQGDDASGDTKVSSVSGDVVVSGVSGDISAEAVSGDVSVAGGTFDDVALDSVNGEIEFTGELAESGRLSAETVNGEIELRFAGTFSADVDVDTLNGRIRNCFGHEARKTSKYGPGWELSFTEGSGSARVKVSTVNGGVSICND